MLELVVNSMIVLVGLYALIGLGFGIFFVVRGVGAIDPDAEEGTWGFRVLILPGSAALWPLLLKRYRDRVPPPEERNAHRDLARERLTGGVGS